MKIYNVTIGYFDEIEQRELTQRYTVSEKSLKKIDCIKYDGKMVDINNSNKYQAVRRKRSGFLEDDQELKLYTMYGLYVKSPLPNDYTLREKMLLQLKALKTLIQLKTSEHVNNDTKTYKKTK